MSSSGILVRGLFKKEGLRFAFADTADLCNDAVRIHDADPVSAEVLCELVTSAALLSVLLEGSERCSAALDYKAGRAGKWLAECGSSGAVRALPGNTRLAGCRDRDDVFGRGNALASVIRFDGGKILNSGETLVSMASPAQDLAMFFCLSDQVETEIAAVQSFAPDPEKPVRAAAGMMLQALPDCGLKAFVRNREAMEQAGFRQLLAEKVLPFENKLRKLADFAGLDASPDNFICETAGIPVYRCRCSRETMRRALMTLGKKDLEDLIAERGEARMECRFCHKKYTFKQGELS